MPKNIQRGFVPTDDKEFREEEISRLSYAAQDILYLIDRGYDFNHAVTFIGNHFQFSSRQRMALLRTISSSATTSKRCERQFHGSLEGKTVYIDGFNLIITLEAAQVPATTLLRGFDGTVRDLCGLHGTYRVIESTSSALLWIGNYLKEKQAQKAVFYLDAPISNSGRLLTAIAEEMETLDFPCEIYLVPNADAELWGKEYVITSDGIILDRCLSWVNGAGEIIASNLSGRRILSFC